MRTCVHVSGFSAPDFGMPMNSTSDRSSRRGPHEGARPRP